MLEYFQQCVVTVSSGRMDRHAGFLLHCPYAPLVILLEYFDRTPNNGRLMPVNNVGNQTENRSLVYSLFASVSVRNIAYSPFRTMYEQSTTFPFTRTVPLDIAHSCSAIQPSSNKDSPQIAQLRRNLCSGRYVRKCRQAFLFSLYNLAALPKLGREYFKQSSSSPAFF